MGQQKPLTNGPAAAAILASGIGCLALGLFTTLAQALAPIKEALNFYSPTGPMSGKTILATAVWLVAWAMLHFLWRSEQVDFGKIFIVTLVLIALEVWPETPILPKPSFFNVDYRCNSG